MKTLFAIVLMIGLLAVSGFAQPAVTSVQDAASNALAGLPNSAIAPGSYFSIYGSGIGPSSSACGANFVNCYWNPYPLPTTLMGVTINVTGSDGKSYPAYPEFVYATQINAVLSSNVPAGAASLTVSFGGSTSTAFKFNVAPMSFGTFSINEAGTGPGIFTNAVTYALVTPFSTVAPGDYVTIWGTGLGALPDPSTEQTGPPPQTNICPSASSCPVTVWVGGVQATVTYAGRSGYTAEDQIDFIVPSESAVQGCYVQVAVQTISGSSNIVGNFNSLAVDPTGPTCSDQDGIDYGKIASVVASKGSANVGAISLLSNYANLGNPLNIKFDNDTVSGEVGTFSGYSLDAFEGFSLAPSVNNCTVQPFLQYPPPKDPILSEGLVTYLDAGPSLSITGTNGTKPIPQNCSPASTTGCGTSGKGYGGLVGGATIAELISSPNPPPPFFLSPTFAILAGNYTVTGNGGAAVGALSASVSVSSAAAGFSWTNQSSVTSGNISRSSPLTITWTGGDPNGFVDITAISSTALTGLGPSPTSPGILVECFAPASAGTFTIPTYVLASLPSTAGATSLVPPGELLVGPASGVTTATAPTGLDELYIFYHFIQGPNVSWQ